MQQKSLSKLGIIGSVGVPARYGGFETLVHYLVPNLRKRFDLTIYCSGKAYKKEERLSNWMGAKLHYIPLQANGIQSILYDVWSIIHAIRNCDVLLILGVSGCLFLPIMKLFSKKKVIVNIDGLEWRRPKWGKFAKAFLRWSEKLACTYADEIVTDNRILKEYVNIRYGIEGNLVEYGADHVKKLRASLKDQNTYPFLKDKYAFKVARIEPENNIHLILKAFSQIPELPLVIVGNWEHSAYGKKLKAAYQRFEHLHLFDPIYEASKLNVLRSNAYVYVHGHSAGGTNPSLVEAMYLGLPVIAYDVIYNRVTTNNQSLFFSNAKDLRKTVLNIEQYPLKDIAKDLKRYAYKYYTWKRVSLRYANIAEGAERVFIPKRIKSAKAV